MESQISCMLYNYDIAFVDVDKYENNKVWFDETFNISKGNIEYRVKRIFDTNELVCDPSAWITEIYSILYSGKQYYCLPSDVDQILSFNKKKMARIDMNVCGAYNEITFGHDTPVYIIIRKFIIDGSEFH